MYPKDVLGMLVGALETVPNVGVLGTVPNALQQFHKISFFCGLFKYYFLIVSPCHHVIITCRTFPPC